MKGSNEKFQWILQKKVLAWIKIHNSLTSNSPNEIRLFDLWE